MKLDVENIGQENTLWEAFSRNELQEKYLSTIDTNCPHAYSSYTRNIRPALATSSSHNKGRQVVLSMAAGFGQDLLFHQGNQTRGHTRHLDCGRRCDGG